MRLVAAGKRAGAQERRRPAMLDEYKQFLFRGNLLDLAVAFVLGVAFASMVSAFADDVIMGTIARYLDLEGVADLAIGPVLVGTFIAAALTFLIVATVLFFVLRAAARFQRAPEAETPDTDEVILLREIRDLLKAERSAP
jgi:large conductance mechanosensitive channel